MLFSSRPDALSLPAAGLQGLRGESFVLLFGSIECAYKSLIKTMPDGKAKLCFRSRV
ncbi:hypothetical protein HMPREF0240_01525 [Clostridium sp. D5]|nr:hypothetical protein HMPREF0240_01525 [Clostridium sp. D5]